MTESICFYFNAFLLPFSVLTPYCCTTVFTLRTTRTSFYTSNFFVFFLIFPTLVLRGFKKVKIKKVIIIITENVDGPGQTACVTADHKRQDDLVTPSWTFPDTVVENLLLSTVLQCGCCARQRRRSFLLSRICDVVAETCCSTATNLLSTVSRSETWFCCDLASCSDLIFWQVTSTISQQQPLYIITIIIIIVIISVLYDTSLPVL